jgi:hypothetical protein
MTGGSRSEDANAPKTTTHIDIRQKQCDLGKAMEGASTVRFFASLIVFEIEDTLLGLLTPGRRIPTLGARKAL